MICELYFVLHLTKSVSVLYFLLLLLLFNAPEQGTVPQRLQRLQHVPEPRARVRLPEKLGNWGKDQQDPLAASAECCLLPPLHQWQVRSVSLLISWLVRYFKRQGLGGVTGWKERWKLAGPERTQFRSHKRHMAYLSSCYGTQEKCWVIQHLGKMARGNEILLP